MHHSEFLDPIAGFLTDIGLPLVWQSLEAPTFLPGIAIRQGRLLVDRSTLAWPGDLLHEAGHLAVLPSDIRATASDALQELPQVPGGGELEALAWSYAAVVHLGLPPTVLFHEGGYKGNAAALSQSYALGVCPGLRGLCEAGLTAAPGFPSVQSDVRYPAMIRWLRD